MTHPTEMTAIRIDGAGGPEKLTPHRMAVPEPGPGQVLVRVEAAGVNRPDVAQRQGIYPVPPGASEIPGLEVAGTIAALGPGVTGPAEGDRVAALVAGGGYAEYCLAEVGCLLPVPEGVPMPLAGALPETLFTVVFNVLMRAGLKDGETLLVHGGASGIGTTAIQLAKARGSQVIVTAGSPEKCAACLELGADHAIDYRAERFEERVLELTGGRGADVIVDMIGGDYLNRNIACAAVEGRIAQIAFMQGHESVINLLPMLQKRVTLTGSMLRPQSLETKARIADTLRREAWPLVASGILAPPIDSSFPLAEAAEAHRRMESGAHVGKIVLRVGE
jgi:putative PIG3 family NAD(P)H quinone oxidoreductase